MGPLVLLCSPAPAQAPPELLRSCIKGNGCPSDSPAEINVLGTGMSAFGLLFGCFFQLKTNSRSANRCRKGGCRGCCWQLPGQWGEGGAPCGGGLLLTGGAERGRGAPWGPGTEPALLRAGDQLPAGTFPA